MRRIALTVAGRGECAFTSTTTNLGAAKGFTDRANGVISKIKVTSGRSINSYSFFPSEGEILLTPSHRFTVTSDMYELDGYAMVDLVEQVGEALVS